VVVGGAALQLHSFSGATRDVDVTVADEGSVLCSPPPEGTAQAKDRQALQLQLQRFGRMLNRATGS